MKMLVLAALILATPAFAQGPPVRAENAWVRATPPGATTAAAYLTLTSPGGDTLTGAATPAAARATVHEMTMDGPVMRMRPLAAGLELPPGKPVTLSPDGLHLMLEGIAAPLKPGQTVPIRLTFAKAPPVDIAARVLPIGARGPGQRPVDPMPGMKMDNQ